VKRKPRFTLERNWDLNLTSAELVDYKRGEDVRLGDRIDCHLAASVKRLDKSIDLS